VKFFCFDLHEHRGSKNNAEYCRSDQITVPLGLAVVSPSHDMGDGVAAGLAQRSRQDLNDPEYKRYLWYLGKRARCPLRSSCSKQPDYLKSIVHD